MLIRTQHRAALSVTILLAALAWTASAAAVPAAPLDYGLYPHLAAAYPSAGWNPAVAGLSVFGRDLFVFTNEHTGLNVGEIVGGEPVRLGQMNLPGVEIDLAAKDWTLYVLKGTGTVQAVSLADPLHPLAGSSVTLPGEPTRLALAGDRLYAACGSAGLVAFDIIGPGVLSYAGAWGADVTSLAVDGRRVAVITQERMDLWDFADPVNPVRLGDSDAAGVSFLREVALSGDIAWVSSGSRTQQLDISDPSAMTLETDRYGRGRLYRDGTDLVIAQSGGGAVNGIEFVDFTTGVFGRRVGWFQEAVAAAVVAGCVIGAADDQVVVLRDGARTYPVPAASVQEDYHFRPVGFCAEDVVVFFELYDDVGLVAQEIGGDGSFLWRLDLGLGPDEHLRAYAGQGSLAAVLCSEAGNQGSPARLRLATVSRHGAIARGDLALDGMAWYADCRIAFLDAQTLLVLEVFDDYYSGPQHLRVIDVADPDDPVELDRVLLGVARAARLEVSGDLVLVSDTHTCEIVLADDRLDLQPTGARDLGASVVLQGERLFAIDSGQLGGPDFAWYARLDTWDLSDPRSPLLIGSHDLPSGNPLHIGDGWAVQAYTGTLFDLTAPGGALPVGNAGPLAWDANFFLANAEYVVYRDPYSETFTHYRFLPAPSARGVVSAVPEEAPRRAQATVAAAPNPFNPRTTIRCTVPAAGPVEVAVFDLAGRRVATLWNGHREAGPHDLVWEGRDAAARPVAAGVYLVRVVQGEQRAVQKVTLVK